MPKTYSQIIRDGGGCIEYIAHIHGFDWAIATTDGLATLMGGAWLDTTVARTLFGKYYHSAGPVLYPADDVVIRSGLEPPGEQTTKLSASMGLVECGGWSLNMRHGDYGIAGHRGLPYLHNLADPRQDPAICYGTLSRALTKSDTSIFVEDATGIHTYVQANKPCPVWVGHECVFATDSTDLGDEIEIEVARYGDASGEVGSAWRSRCQSLYLDEYEGVQIAVSDRPLFGATGRPVTLWAIVLSPDGTTIWDIARARTGRISTSVSSEDGQTSIGCDGWTDWLRTPLRAKSVNATLRGYLITRPSASVTPPEEPSAHLILKYFSAPATYSTEDLWFCNAGASLWFDTYEELVDHINNELMACGPLGGGSAYGNPALTDHFYLSGCKLHHMFTFGSHAWAAGTLAWAFGWGWFPEHFYDKAELLANLSACGNSGFVNERRFSRPDGMDGVHPAANSPFLALWQWDGSPPIYPIGADYFYSPLPGNPTPQMHPGAAPYYYQYPWDNDDEAVFDWSATPPTTKHFPLNSIGGDYRLYFSEDTPVDVVSDDECVLFDATHNEGLVDTVDSVTNSIIFSAAGEYKSDASTAACLRWRGGSAWGIGAGGPGNSMCFPMWVLWKTKVDPWKMFAQMRVTLPTNATNPSHIFRAMLGDEGCSVTIAQRCAADHIPDAVGVNPAANFAHDHLPSIDWASFDAAIGPPIICEAKFGLRFPDEGEVLLSQVLEGFCLTYGVSPTWEYDPIYKMWRMKFRPLGIVNATEAAINGRDLNESNIRRDKHRIEHTRYNQYSRIDYAGSWNGKEFLLSVPTNSTGAMSVTGGRSQTLSVRDYITQYPDNSDIINDPVALEVIKEHFALGLLSRVCQPAPTVTIETTPATQLSIGCGQTVILTDSTIYDPYTNALGMTDRGALCTEIRHTLYGPVQRVTVQIAGRLCYGWAPALSVEVGDSARTAANTISISSHTDPANNLWSPVEYAMTDLAYFDCNRILDGAVSPVGCSCGDYIVTIVQLDTATPVVYRDVVISAVNYAAGTATLTAAGLGDDWLANGYDTYAWIVYFEDYDHAIEPCQAKWLFAGDGNHKLVDAAAVEHPGMVWV